MRHLAWLLAIVVLAGCGSDGTKARRHAVDAYIDGVRAAQVDLIGHQGDIGLTLARFSLTPPTPTELRDLERARSRIAQARLRVAALDAPTDARKLDRLLLSRLDLQRNLVAELIRTKRDVARLGKLNPQLQAASRRLRADLDAIASSPTVPAGGSASTLERYGEAFGRYGDALRPLVAAAAPAGASLLGPTLATEQQALRRSVTLCDRIRRDLKARKVADANRAVHDLLALAASLGGDTIRAAEDDAARAYNARVRRVDVLGTAVAIERARLVQSIG